MVTVIVSFPNNQRRDVLLNGVPRVGDSMRFANGIADHSFDVTQVLWMEADRGVEPSVIVFVQSRPSGKEV